MKIKMKDIYGYTGIYAVTKDGRIWSYPKKWRGANGCLIIRKGKFLKYTKENGMCRISLFKNCIRKNFLISHIVAKSFIPNSMDREFVYHKDGDYTNNKVSNLRWGRRNKGG